MVLKDIKKNGYKQYYKADVVDLGLPLFNWGQTPDGFYSKSRLKRELNITLSDDRELYPDGFSRGKNGYYPVWKINTIKPYSDEEYEKAKKEGLDLDNWNDYESFFGLGEDENYE